MRKGLAVVMLVTGCGRIAFDDRASEFASDASMTPSVCGNPTAGPAMVPLAPGYCIDATEVTRSQYALWLAANPATGGQITACTWNTSYTPVCHWPPGASGALPVVCVDWCDAYAYCAASGKRLCGRIGGGPIGIDEVADANRSQWFAACTSGGQHPWPYGDSYSATTCNGFDNGVGGPVAVASMTSCTSSVAGYAGVFDLSGNVWEWEDNCDASTGATDRCRVRGCSFFNSSGVAQRCDDTWNFDRNDAAEPYGDVGFRCCS